MRTVMMRLVLGALALGAASVLAVLLLAVGRPAQPLPLGTVQWTDEAGVTVDSVERTPRIEFHGRRARANGEYYIVHARILAPYGLRPHWNDRDVEVRTFAGTGGTMRDRRFAVDPVAQAILDARTGRPGPDHVILGAVRHEDWVFDLPKNVEQPALLVAPANELWGVFFVLFGHVWQPHRFNLRYD